VDVRQRIAPSASLAPRSDPCSYPGASATTAKQLSPSITRSPAKLNQYFNDDMPRKSTQVTPASASRDSSKRPAPDTPNRQSKRARATARKSYAEPETDEDEVTSKRTSPVTDEDDDANASAFDAESDGDGSLESSLDEQASDEGTNTSKATSRRHSSKQGLTLRKKHADEKELWRPGAKLAPGTQLIIKKPKAREAGDTPYLDETLHPNTMLFLKDLAAHNDRQWLKSTSTESTLLVG
jgi:hypothetical protein